MSWKVVALVVLLAVAAYYLFWFFSGSTTTTDPDVNANAGDYGADGSSGVTRDW